MIGCRGTGSAVSEVYLGEGQSWRLCQRLCGKVGYAVGREGADESKGARGGRLSP